jgi:hypothetical protein
MKISRLIQKLLGVRTHGHYVVRLMLLIRKGNLADTAWLHRHPVTSSEWNQLLVRLVYLPFEAKARLIFNNSVPTAKKKQRCTVTKINCLMLFKEIIDVYIQNHNEAHRYKVQCYWLLKQVMHIGATTRPLRVECVSARQLWCNSFTWLLAWQRVMLLFGSIVVYKWWVPIATVS